MEHYVTAMADVNGRTGVGCRCGWMGWSSQQNAQVLWDNHRLVMEQADPKPRPAKLGIPSKRAAAKAKADG